jgi:hypothetical protein
MGVSALLVLTANILETERADRPPATAPITRSRKSDE